MDRRLRRAVTVGRAVVHEIRTERITFMAGSIAYHAFVSLLPLLLLVLAVVAALDRPEIERGIISLAAALLSPGAGDVLVAELRSTSPGVSLLGLAVLVWGTLRIFRGLDTAFSDIYESEARNTFADQLRDGVVVLVCIAVAILVGAALERSLTFDGTAGWIAGRAVLIVGLALAFLPMYYVFPDEPGITVREVLPGVGFAAVGLTAFASLFRVYLEASGGADGSVLGGVLVFLTWLYFSGLVVLVGVAINAVLSNRSRDVDIRPVLGGRPRRADHDIEATASGVDRAALVTAIERLRGDLRAGEAVTVSTGDDTVTLPGPDAVAVDVDPSRLPFLSDVVSVELRWAADDTTASPAAADGAPPTDSTPSTVDGTDSSSESTGSPDDGDQRDAP
jgi:membrane protein